LLNSYQIIMKKN